MGSCTEEGCAVVMYVDDMYLGQVKYSTSHWGLVFIVHAKLN